MLINLPWIYYQYAQLYGIIINLLRKKNSSIYFPNYLIQVEAEICKWSKQLKAIQYRFEDFIQMTFRILMTTIRMDSTSPKEMGIGTKD